MYIQEEQKIIGQMNSPKPNNVVGGLKLPKLDLSEEIPSPREAYIDTQRAAMNGTGKTPLELVHEQPDLESESVNVTAMQMQAQADKSSNTQMDIFDARMAVSSME
jgi:hypothetical protein